MKQFRVLKLYIFKFCGSEYVNVEIPMAMNMEYGNKICVLRNIVIVWQGLSAPGETVPPY
jgi:hypothetical protein